jgi:hypothetical protein
MSAVTAGHHIFRDNLNMARPMGQGPPAMTRPVNPGAMPLVVSATGLGSGGGVGGGANSDAAWGHFHVYVGLAPAASGIIVVQWPLTPSSAPGFFADWASLIPTGANPYSIAWTALAPLVTNSKPLRLSYQWAIAD